MILQTAMFTNSALNCKDWGGVEWHGSEEPWIPYVWIWEYSLGYAKSNEKGDFELEAEETFPFLIAYKNGEFLASFDVPILVQSGTVITITDFQLNINVPCK